MENLTSKLLNLANGKKYYIIRQATYKGNTYFFTIRTNEEEEDFTDEFKFFVKVDGNNEEFNVLEVKDKEILKVLASNIKLD